MRHRIVLVGNSPLMYFLAKILDKDVANQVHYSVIWLTDDNLRPELFDKRFKGESREKVELDHVKLVKATIKSLSLRDKRILTAKGEIGYDFLCTDQAASYTNAELKTIKKAVDQLAMAVQGQLNLGKKASAQIYCKGEGAEVVQLACSIKHFLQTEHRTAQQHIELKLEEAVDPSVGEFLRKYSVSPEKCSSVVGKMTIEAPQQVLPTSKLRGLKVGAKGYVINNSDLTVHGYPGVFVIDGRVRRWQTLLRFQKTIAKVVADNLVAAAERKSTRYVELSSKAYLLEFGQEKYLQLGELETGGVRATIVRGLETRTT